MSASGPQRQCRDWIESFLEYSDGIPSPALFRLWSAIAIVAGAMERRVWTETARSVMYPNLYTLLVAPPGIGKSQAIQHVGEFWHSVKEFKVSPDNLTKAALIDAIQVAERKLVLNATTLVEYNSLLVSSSEFGVLVPSHDLEFLNTLNHIYDNPRNYRENRRTLNKQIDIPNPQLNIIGGTQPAYLASLLPEEAWGMGFTSRIIMVYASEAIRVNLFEKQFIDKELGSRLRDDLGLVAKMYGAMTWTEEAQAAVQSWLNSGLEPVPQHSKLEHYNTRRVLHVLKLAMVANASRGGDHVVTLSDFTRAKDWLLHAELTMPDIFRDMVGRSDHQVIQELHFYAWKLWVSEKRPIHRSRLIYFLQSKVPSEKIEKVLEIAEKSNVLKREAGTELFRPAPKHEHGLE